MINILKSLFNSFPKRPLNNGRGNLSEFIKTKFEDELIEIKFNNEGTGNLKNHIKTPFEDELIDVRFNNVGSYENSSRTRKIT